MSILSQTLKIFLVAVFLNGSNVFAEEVDNGTDVNGDLIVSETLSLICGLSSKNPEITTECINKLVEIYQSGEVRGTAFKNYLSLQKVVLSEYAAAYMENALKQLVASSGYEDEINEKMCIESTSAKCSSVSNDTRDEIEYNNKLATNNAAILLETFKLKAQGANYDGIYTILDQVVPYKDDVAINNSSADES